MTGWVVKWLECRCGARVWCSGSSRKKDYRWYCSDPNCEHSVGTNTYDDEEPEWTVRLEKEV